MKASDQAKLAGFESLNELSFLSGVSPQALSYQAKHKPEIFKAHLEKYKKEKQLPLADMLKLFGFKSLSELSKLSQTSSATLKKYYENKPDLFRAILEMNRTGY